MGKLNQGASYNFFEKVTITSTTFQDNADITLDIKWQLSFSLVNEGSDVVEYSMNGNTLAGDMTPGTPTASMIFDNRSIGRLWFRSPSGNPITVRVEAWSRI